MPFRSEAQRRWMWATHPAMARRWAREFGKSRKRLPKHVKRKGAKGARRRRGSRRSSRR